MEKSYKAGDIIRYPGKDKKDYKFESIILAECDGYENEVRKDDEGYYIYIIKKHNIDEEIDSDVYKVGELKISHFCNRKMAKTLIRTILDNGFLVTRSSSDEKYIYLDVIKVVSLAIIK